MEQVKGAIYLYLKQYVKKRWEKVRNHLKGSNNFRTLNLLKTRVKMKQKM